MSEGAFGGLENVRACCGGRHTIGHSMQWAKQMGFADAQIADIVHAHRKSLSITPFVIPLLNTPRIPTYNPQYRVQGTVVLGSGVYCIGSSVEFDWCAEI